MNDETSKWKEIVIKVLVSRRLWAGTVEPAAISELREVGPSTRHVIIYEMANYLANPPVDVYGPNFWGVAALCRLLGEFKALEAVPLLKIIAENQNKMYEYRELRPSAISALGQIGDHSIIPTLISLRSRRDIEDISQNAILNALKNLGESVDDAASLLTQLGLKYTLPDEVNSNLQLIQRIESRLDELNQDKRGDYWFCRAFISKNFQPEDMRMKEYCIRSLVEFLERDVLWNWLGVDEFRTQGSLVELIESTPGLEDLVKKIADGSLKLKGFTKTLFFFLSNSAIEAKVIRRVPAEDWAKRAREGMQSPDADVIVFEYNEWECPTISGIEENDFHRIEAEVVRGISKALIAYGINENSAEHLAKQMKSWPNEVSQRMIFIVEHVNYPTDHSHILEAIQDLPETDDMVNGRAMQAWNPLAQRGIKTHLSSMRFVRSFQMGSRINSLAMVPKGQMVMAGLENGQMVMIDYAASRPWGWYVGHHGAIHSIDVSRDSTLALTGGQDQVVRLWSIDTTNYFPDELSKKVGSGMMVFSDDDKPTGRNCKLEMRKHRGVINSVAISSDGRRSLSGGDDRTVYLWDLVSGNCLREYKGHSGKINAVAFSPDGRYATSGSEDHTIIVWNLENGRKEKVLKGHEYGVSALEVLGSISGGRLITGDADGKVHIWDLESGKRYLTSVDNTGVMGSFHSDLIHSIASLPCDTRTDQHSRLRFSAGKDGMLVGAELTSGHIILKEPHGGSVNSVVISPDGHFLLSASDDKLIRLWQLEWDYEFPPMTNWHESARPYLENFISLHLPTQAPAEHKFLSLLFNRGKSTPTQKASVASWSEDDFHNLLNDLGMVGFGWLSMIGIREELERMVKRS